jgi:hypothetical protein
MRHYGIPGKNALDLTTVYHVEPGSSKGHSLTQAVLFGLSPNTNMEVEAPVLMGDRLRSDSLTLGFTSRLWQFDGFGHKKFIVANVEDTLRGANAIIHHMATGGGAFVVEHLDWLAFASLSVEAGASGGHHGGAVEEEAMTVMSGRSPWGALAYGRRFIHIPETQTDAVAFVEAYRRLDSPVVQYLAAELMYQPNRRMLFKLGHRFPVSEGEGVDVKAHWALHMEVRL